MTNPKIFIISGPSGSGKDTIIKGIKKLFPNLQLVKSYTTRPKRNSDEVGNRKFVSPEEFKTMIKAGEFIEYEQYCDNYYGRTKQDVNAILSQGQSIIMEVEVKGTVTYKKLFGNQLISIFVKYESPEKMLNRIKQNRPETTAEDLQNRLDTMQQELTYEQYYDHSVINYEGKPDLAISQVADTIKHSL